MRQFASVAHRWGNRKLGEIFGNEACCARHLFGIAPIDKAANKGIEDRRIKLGSVFPGETPAVFGDALRRLASRATYLYQDGPAIVFNAANCDKAGRGQSRALKRDQDKIVTELDSRLRGNLAKVGDFYRVHRLPSTSGDVPDNLEASLVVLSIDQAYSKEENNQPNLQRGRSLRIAAIPRAISQLARLPCSRQESRTRPGRSICKFLAWDSILKESEELNLTQHQVTQAKTQRQAADGVVHARLPEMYNGSLCHTRKSADSSCMASTEIKRD